MDYTGTSREYFVRSMSAEHQEMAQVGCVLAALGDCRIEETFEEVTNGGGCAVLRMSKQP